MISEIFCLFFIKGKHFHYGVLYLLSEPCCFEMICQIKSYFTSSNKFLKFLAQKTPAPLMAFAVF